MLNDSCHSKSYLSARKKYFYPVDPFKACICLMVFFCIALRFYKINADAPLNFSHIFVDEGWKNFNSRNLALFGKFTFGSELPWGILYSPFYSLIYTLVFEVFGVSLAVGRTASIVICFFTAILFYFTSLTVLNFLKEDTKREQISAFSTLLFASDFPYFIYSRSALPEVLCVFLVTLSIFMYLKHQDKGFLFHMLFGALLNLLIMTKLVLLSVIFGFFILEILKKRTLPFLLGLAIVPGCICVLLYFFSDKGFFLFQFLINKIPTFLYSEKKIVFLINCIKSGVFNLFNLLSTWFGIGFFVEYQGPSLLVFPFLWLWGREGEGRTKAAFRVLGVLFVAVLASLLLMFLLFQARKWYILTLVPILYLMTAATLGMFVHNRGKTVGDIYLSSGFFVYLLATLWVVFSVLFPVTHNRVVTKAFFSPYFLRVPMVSQPILETVSNIFGKYEWWWHSRYFAVSFVLAFLTGTVVYAILKTKHTLGLNNVGKIFLSYVMIVHFGINIARYSMWVSNSKELIFNSGKQLEKAVPKDALVYGASFLALSSKTKLLYRGFSIQDMQKTDYVLLSKKIKIKNYRSSLKYVTSISFVRNATMSLFALRKPRLKKRRKHLHKLLYYTGL